MTESGGPTTQAGIDYQNRIAALYLGDLLSLDGQTATRVIAVRVEAPGFVDDIVVTRADGRCYWIQAKLALAKHGPEWEKVWRHMKAQEESADFGSGDRLCLAIGESNNLAEMLRECAERTISSDDAQWRSRMSESQRGLVEGIDAMVGASSHAIFQRLDIVTHTPSHLDLMAADRLPASNLEPLALLSILQTLVSRGGRRRKQFHAPDLRATVAREHGVRLQPPTDWGAQAYLAVVTKGRVDVPGTSVGGRADTAFHWLRASRRRDHAVEFDDEQTFLRADPSVADVDLRVFPTAQLSQCIVHAGPGFGKSSLLSAVAASAAADGVHVPAIVPLSALGASGLEALAYLNGPLNEAYSVQMDWTRLCETGAALLLFDGLDEVALNERVGVANRLIRFTQRYPTIPWMLTVRDLAIVPAGLDAEKLELNPLTNEEMDRFALTIQPNLDRDEAKRLIEQVTAYPELERLVRIPLFLALLVATWLPGSAVPTRRTELIETYLKTLFRPEEHKDAPRVRVRDPELLRSAMQGLAHRLIESGEIGSSEREVRKWVIAYATADVSADVLFEDAIRCGILKRSTSARLAFAFPIIQEYFAGQELAEQHASAIPARAAQAVQRPWAQTVQFALERLPDGTAIAAELMDKPGDAFATAARLLARCILNGMPCSEQMRQRVGDTLARAWPRQSFWTAKRVGQLIDDGWSSPPSQAVRKALLRYDLQHDGADRIIARLADDALTLDAISSYLKHGRQPVHLGQVQPEADRLAGKVLALYLTTVREGGYAGHEWAAGSLVGRLDPSAIAPEDLDQGIADAELPRDVRLALIGLRGGKPTPLYWQLTADAMSQPDESSYWAAVKGLARSDAPALHFERLLRDHTLLDDARHSIADHINEVIPDIGMQIALIERLAIDASLPGELRIRMRIRAANLGHAPALDALLSDFGSLSAAHALHALHAISHFPDRDTGERVIAALRARPNTPADKVLLASALMLGSMYKYEVPYYRFGAIIPMPLHPSFADFLAIIDEWWRTDGFDLIDRLRMTRIATEYGLRGATDVLRMLAMKVIAEIDTCIGNGDFDNNPFNTEIRNALGELGRKRCCVPLSLAIQLAGKSDSNAEIGALIHIGSIGTREALEYLIERSRQGEEFLVLGSIESIASRLGITVVRRDDGLAIATD